MKVIVLTKNINTSGKKNPTQQLCNKEAFDEVEYINILLQSSRSVPSFQSLPLQRVNSAYYVDSIRWESKYHCKLKVNISLTGPLYAALFSTLFYL